MRPEFRAAETGTLLPTAVGGLVLERRLSWRDARPERVREQKLSIGDGSAQGISPSFSIVSVALLFRSWEPVPGWIVTLFTGLQQSSCWIADKSDRRSAVTVLGARAGTATI